MNAAPLHFLLTPVATGLRACGMKTHRHGGLWLQKLLPLLCGAALLLSAATSHAAPAEPPLSDAALALKKMADRSKLTKTRISALLRDRLNPVPLAPNSPNPFQIGGGGTATLTAPAATEQIATVETEPVIPDAEPNPDVATLAHFVAELKISGHFVIGGVSRLTINQVLYKEGDLIRQGTPEAPYYIKIEKITDDELTLSLNDTVQKLKFKI